MHSETGLNSPNFANNLTGDVPNGECWLKYLSFAEVVDQAAGNHLATTQLRPGRRFHLRAIDDGQGTDIVEHLTEDLA
jgi:hypothetical protein